MCNLYHLSPRPTGKVIAKTFNVVNDVLFPEKDRVYPVYEGLFIRARADSGPGREAVIGQWGLAPHWVKDDPKKFGRMTNNARAETLASKPTFRSAYKSRRCLIPATAFCEPKLKVWYAFTLPDQPLFAMAGLWETWGDKEKPLHSYTMITTDANPLVAEYHAKQRMPVILDPEDYELWLTGDVAKAGKLLRTYDPAKMEVAPIAK